MSNSSGSFLIHRVEQKKLRIIITALYWIVMILVKGKSNSYYLEYYFWLLLNLSNNFLSHREMIVPLVSSTSSTFPKDIFALVWLSRRFATANSSENTTEFEECL